jgi:predicted dienelactone hydrolase
MLRKRVFFVVLIAALIVPTLAILPSAGAQEGEVSSIYAAHGPYTIGVMSFEAETPSHPTKITVWYPALNPAGAEELPPAAPLRDAAPNPSGAPYPLVIFEPGWLQPGISASWLGKHLPGYGFVLVAMDPIDLTEDGTGLLRRPQDVVWQLDYADILSAAGGDLEGVIDQERVAVVGHSMGGYTALAAGGARIDWDYFSAWCSENHGGPRDHSIGFGVNYCDILADDEGLLAPLAGLDVSQPGLWPSWGDPRVDAIVPLSPPFWMVLGPDGVKSISIPMLLMGGSKDIIVPPEWDQFYENVSTTDKALVVFENGDHDNYLMQPLTRHFITAFLLATLKGDTDAAVALAPDAVSFPGIMYQAQGF